MPRRAVPYLSQNTSSAIDHSGRGIDICAVPGRLGEVEWGRGAPPPAESFGLPRLSIICRVARCVLTGASCLSRDL